MGSLAGQALAATDRSASQMICDTTGIAAKTCCDASTKAIGDKMALESKLQGNLSAESTGCAAEMALLAACMNATMQAIESKKAPLEAVAAWYATRGTRFATERLCDPVKHDLEVMMATLKESMRLLESALSAQQS